jgi:hypothetical protein
MSFAIELLGNNQGFNLYPKAKEMFPALFGGWWMDDRGQRHPKFYNVDTDKYLAYVRHEGALDDLQILESKGYQAKIIPDPYPDSEIQ